MTCSFSTDGDRVVSGHEDGEVGSAFPAAASPMGAFGIRFRVRFLGVQGLRVGLQMMRYP